MAKTKKQITSYEQLRKCIGAQNLPSSAEIRIMRRVFDQEMETENGEVSWAMMLVYIAGMLKGAGIVTHEELNNIVEGMQQGKEKSLHYCE